MDVSRPTATPSARSPSATLITTRQPASAERAEQVQFPNPPRSDQGAAPRVVQGELLYRAHSPYQSTRAFIDERRLELAQPADRSAESPRQTGAAISQYLKNTGPESAAELAHGRSLDFFV